ncbi:MAG: HNH endonuclease [Pseudomonadota bacterium]|nr:HNH endonuclease [Pseudomonadota bacterium]
MNPLQRALIEKAGHDHGFEYILPGAEDAVRLASARHNAQVHIVPIEGGFDLTFSSSGQAQLIAELARSFPAAVRASTGFNATNERELARFLRRGADLARALPNQAAVDFEARLKEELTQFPASLIHGTEIERLVRQRVGQQTFRQAMLDYWGDACAVTGIALPEVLRASHARPWAECESDTERLDVFNGFLLSANLDALFDRCLISFMDDGDLLVSPAISDVERRRLGLDKPLRLRWLAAEHLHYLRFQRDRFKEST